MTYSFRELEHITIMAGIMARRHDAKAISRHIYVILQAKDRKPWMLRNLKALSQLHAVFSKFIYSHFLQNVSPIQYQLLKYMSVLRTFSFKPQQNGICMSHIGISIKDLLLSEYWPFMSHCVDHHLLTKEISENVL